MEFGPIELISVVAIVATVASLRLGKVTALRAMWRSARQNYEHGHRYGRSRRYSILTAMRIGLWVVCFTVVALMVFDGFRYMLILIAKDRGADRLDSMVLRSIQEQEVDLLASVMTLTILAAVLTGMEFFIGGWMDAVARKLEEKRVYIHRFGWPESIPPRFMREPIDLWAERNKELEPAETAGAGKATDVSVSYRNWRNAWPVWSSLVVAYRARCLREIDPLNIVESDGDDTEEHE